jgi:hypothetical protein
MKEKHIPKERQVLDDKLRRAGMLTITQILKGTLMDAMHACSEVVDLETFGEWLSLTSEGFLSMKAKLELDKRHDDELFEWVLAHSAALHTVSINFKKATKAK